MNIKQSGTKLYTMQNTGELKAAIQYAIYMEGIEKVIVGTKEQIEAYLRETLGYSLMLITWHDDCITVGMEPDNAKSDIPLVTIERL